MKPFKSQCLLFVACVFTHFTGVSAQKMIGVGTRYNDTFRHWMITTEDDELRGELRLRWDLRDDWSEWDLEIGDVHVSIEQKWKDDPNLWEFRCNGIVVNARTAWPGEFTRWKLSDGTHQFNWGTRYYNLREDWQIETRTDDRFRMYTYWEGDPREWVIEDELPGDVSVAMRAAMIFLALHFSTPRL